MVHTFPVKTSRKTEMIDITPTVEQVVRKTGVKEGVCMIYIPHTTAAVTINENADPTVPEDILMALDKIVPSQGGYRHAEGNSPAHIKAGLMGSSQTVFVDSGALFLGTWQGIFFCEFDGPRSRKVHVKVMET